MNHTIALIGTMDTKGHIYAFVKRIIEEKGFNTLIINTGILGEPTITPDISRETVYVPTSVDYTDIRINRKMSGNHTQSE